MDVSFYGFFERVISEPLLLVSVLLTLGVILVNGWTDAPNAIATCVATRCLAPNTAIITAAVFNFLGVLVMSIVNASVAETITRLADFGNNPVASVTALAAALLSIVVWATLAWYFGIPTSESHALIAGITGAAVALNGSFSGVNGKEWLKVIVGLGASVLLGVILGFFICKVTVFAFKNRDRRKTEKTFRGAQIFGAAAMSFMHGAQDGQKFMGVMLLCLYLSAGEKMPDDISVPFWLIAVCSVVMALGTACGGKKIIKSVGMNMVKLEKYQGFSADTAAAVCLLFCSLTGIPVSTTHAKTSAVMGVGASRRLRSVNVKVVKEMALTWLLTFPLCGLLGFITSKIFMIIF